MTSVKEKLNEAILSLRSASETIVSLRARYPDADIGNFVDDIHPRLLTIIEGCAEKENTAHDYPEGRAYKVTAVFTEEVFARSDAEAMTLHLKLLSRWGAAGELEGNPMQDIEWSETPEGECYISFKEEGAVNA